MEDNGYTYVAVFNFDSTSKTKEFNLADVGLNPTEEYSAVELWDNSSVTISGDSFTTNSIAARSANLYKIESGADTQENGAETLFYEDFVYNRYNNGNNYKQFKRLDIWHMGRYSSFCTDRRILRQRKFIKIISRKFVVDIGICKC